MIWITNPRLKSWAAILVVVGCISLQAQTKTNLDVFKILVDSSITEIADNIPDLDREIFLNLKLGSSFNIFEDHIYKSFQMRGKNLSSVLNSSENSELSYTIENAIVSYGDSFRGGFLGIHYVPRTITLTGSYRFQFNQTKIENFSYKSADTVMYDEIETIENSSYPFTKGEIPPESFLSNLFEPIVAIATAAVVITLFFTVRSK